MLMNENGFNSYQNNQLEAKAASASPTELIVMLIDGFNDNLIKAKGHMANKRIYEKGEAINRCMNIVIGLDSAIDLQNGGEAAQNLAQLYTYIQSKLLEASSQNSIEILDEIELLMNNLKEGWQGIS